MKPACLNIAIDCGSNQNRKIHHIHVLNLLSVYSVCVLNTTLPSWLYQLLALNLVFEEILIAMTQAINLLQKGQLKKIF